MINPTSAVPLYVQVADDLRRRIEMGEFSESGVLPSENGFCEEYEVSRATIRKAIQTLVDDDVLDTRHGKGTFIRQPKIVSSLSTFKGFTYFAMKIISKPRLVFSLFRRSSRPLPSVVICEWKRTNLRFTSNA